MFQRARDLCFQLIIKYKTSILISIYQTLINELSICHIDVNTTSSIITTIIKASSYQMGVINVLWLKSWEISIKECTNFLWPDVSVTSTSIIVATSQPRQQWVGNGLCYNLEGSGRVKRHSLLVMHYTLMNRDQFLEFHWMRKVCATLAC